MRTTAVDASHFTLPLSRRLPGRFGRCATTSRDTFRLGRHDEKLCLLTVDSSVIDVIGVAILIYYRDTYHREK